jgi:thiamine monophosphate kinase
MFMRFNWRHGEKEFLKALHDSMNANNLDWRDDAIITPIADNLSLLYSIDNVSQIKNLASRAESMISYGKWATSVICNDILACGVLPQGLALDIGIGDFSEDDFNNFIKGVLSVCYRYGTIYEGGNINTSDSVSGVAWGTSPPEKIIKRSGAKDNAVIFVTTDVGIGWTIKLMLDYMKNSNKPITYFSEFNDYIEMVNNYKNDPCVNVELFEDVWAANVIQCGMDLTDGVIEFGYEIFERTNLGVVFSFDKEINPFICTVAKILELPSKAFRFEPGYDTPFAHGWCIDKNDVSKVVRIFEKYQQSYTILGYTSSKLKGVNYNTGQGLVALPRYWDDKICNRGSIENWKTTILPIFEAKY